MEEEDYQVVTDEHEKDYSELAAAALANADIDHKARLQVAQQDAAASKAAVLQDNTMPRLVEA